MSMLLVKKIMKMKSEPIEMQEHLAKIKAETTQMPEHLDTAQKKLKELYEAVEVCKKIEEQVSWACDFTSYISISQALEPIYEAVDSGREELEKEIDYIEYQIEEYLLNKYEFDIENAIEL